MELLPCNFSAADRAGILEFGLESMLSISEKQNPFGLHTITPYLVADDVTSLIHFLKKVFDAELRGETTIREDGSIQHVEMQIGDSVVMMGEPAEETAPMPAMLYVYVDDCDATYKDALAAGATSIREPAVYPHGDRYGGIKDPTGNIWWVVTHVGKTDRDV